VTLIPCRGRAASALISGSRLHTSSAEGSSARISNLFRPVKTGSTPRAMFSPGTGPGAVTGSAGKSRVIHSPSFRAVSVPDKVSKVIGRPDCPLPLSKSTKAQASVAWPQSSTSCCGVNHLRFHPPETGSINAVSECFISAATCCIHVVSAGSFENTDRGGIPAKRGSGKGIDQVQFCMHGKGICVRAPINNGL
jgi:hypothetical protein